MSISPRRMVLAVLAAGLGYLGVSFSVAQALTASRPALAHRLAPYDGRITAALAAQLAGAEPLTGDRDRSDTLARRALRQDPTAVAAAATLGLNAQLRADAPRARRLFAFAEGLSRRHLPVQVWAIEDAVGRGDVAGALHHYDIALRTSERAPDLLFPVLAAASADPGIRDALVRTLASRPVWGEPFVNYAAAEGPDPLATATLFARLARAGVAIPTTARAMVVNALVVGGHVDRGWSYYAAGHPGADRRRSRDPLFRSELDVPTRFDWLPTNDADIATSIRGGSFDFDLPPSVGGDLLQQTQLLPAGDYRLTGRSAGIDQPAGARPYWILTCVGGRELGRVPVPNSAEARGTFGGRLTVPAGCPVQLLKLVARGSDSATGVTGQILGAQLAPAG